MATADGLTISTIASSTTSPVRCFHPFIPLPTWLAASLMESGSDDITELCVYAICDINTRATDSSPSEAMTVLSQEDDDDDSNEMGFVTVQTPDSTKKLLQWVLTLL
jgi:hypothetical protein